VIALDARGTPARIGRVTGRPTHMEILTTACGPVVVLATEKGEVKGFGIH
jgi:hypothetical protein